MRRFAVFSPCRTYRYSLSRVWAPKLPRVVIIGLNPSTADELADDPTVRRCISFAKKWDFGSLVLVNLFAYRSTNPAALLDVEDPIGPANDKHIVASVRTAGRVILAWGNKGSLACRDMSVMSLLPEAHCFGTTMSGHPKHPLYLAGNTPIRPFRTTAAAA